MAIGNGDVTKPLEPLRNTVVSIRDKNDLFRRGDSAPLGCCSVVGWRLELIGLEDTGKIGLFLLMKFISAIAKEMRRCWLGTKPRMVMGILLPNRLFSRAVRPDPRRHK